MPSSGRVGRLKKKRLQDGKSQGSRPRRNYGTAHKTIPDRQGPLWSCFFLNVDAKSGWKWSYHPQPLSDVWCYRLKCLWSHVCMRECTRPEAKCFRWPSVHNHWKFHRLLASVCTSPCPKLILFNKKGHRKCQSDNKLFNGNKLAHKLDIKNMLKAFCFPLSSATWANVTWKQISVSCFGVIHHQTLSISLNLCEPV